MNVAVCGVARSGSTLLWQLLSSVLGPGIGQTHPGAETSLKWDKYVVTIRHPFDVAASRYRVRLSRDPSTSGPIGLEAEIAVMLEHFQGVRSILDFCPSALLRYEEFYNDYDIAFDCFQKFFKIIVKKEKREEVKTQYSLEENTRRAKRMKSFLDVDPTSRLHGDHIGAVHPGSWKDQMPDWGREMILEKCSVLAKGWGYEIN